MKTIIEMAREAGLVFNEEHGTDIAKSIHLGRVQAFAALVRADENKACQDVCDDVYRAWTLREDEDEIAHPDPIDCKLAIRARGNT